MTDEQEGRPHTGRPSAHPDRTTEPWGPMDAALAAYRGGDHGAYLIVDTDVGGPEEVPVSLFFRTPADMGPVESAALAEARGRVLDLGAGAGALAVPLRGRGLSVCAAEILPAGRAAMAEAGLDDVRVGGVDVVAPGERFDTVLVLMNGLGLAGTLDGLAHFLGRLAATLSPGGQVLADSTDPREWGDPGDGRYPGEVHMQLRFGNVSGPPFPFLFVDEEEVAAAALAAGLEAEVVTREEGGRFLVRLTPLA